MFNKLSICAAALLAAAISTAWFVRPDGTGAIEMNEAMVALGLDPNDPADVIEFKQAAKAGEYTLHLTRNATYDIPCSRDGGTTVKWFSRSQKIDADLLYKFNGANDTLRILGFGEGSVQNNVICPGNMVRVDDNQGDLRYAVMTDGSYQLTLDGAPLADEMRRP